MPSWDDLEESRDVLVPWWVVALLVLIVVAFLVFGSGSGGEALEWH